MFSRAHRMVFAALLAGTTAIAAEPLPSAAFSPGEQMQYRIHYLGMDAGTAKIVVGPRTTQWGREVWPITTHAISDRKLFFFPIKDRFVSYWDFETERTIGSDFYVDENRKRRYQRIRLDHQGGSAHVYKSEKKAESVHAVEPGTSDIASATFALRNQDLAVGREFAVPVFTGTKSFVMKAAVLGIERINTALGPREVFKVRARTDFSGKLKSKRDVFAWFTTDPSHVPVRIEAEFVLGAVVAELEKYSAGNIALRDAPAGAPQDG